MKSTYSLIHKILLLVVFTVISFTWQQNAFAAEYNETVIPDMTSNTAPSGIAFSNTTWGPSYDAWKAFDRSYPASNGGAQSASHANFATNPWMLGYEFPTNYVIVKYALMAPDWSPGLPQMAKDWTFEGWNGSSWEVLHTVTNETNWSVFEKRTYTVPNPKSYKKYQIRVTANNGYPGYVYITEFEMMGYEGDTPPPVDVPVLTGTAGDSENILSWEPVSEANGYTIKRGTSSGGPYETEFFVGGDVTSYKDTDVTNGTVYYYVLTAVTNSGESEFSNEVALEPRDSNNPPPPPTGDYAILVIKLLSGLEKEYDLPMSEIAEFIEWYEDRADGNGTEAYVFEKEYNLGPFTSRKEYVAFSKIQSFEVMEYDK